MTKLISVKVSQNRNTEEDVNYPLSDSTKVHANSYSYIKYTSTTFHNEYQLGSRKERNRENEELSKLF